MFNGHGQPLELLYYEYRKLFHLTHKQLLEEPVDQVYLNLEIHAMINQKKAKEMKYAGK